VLAFNVIENGRSWLFSTKMGVVWPLIIDQSLVHLTPHMFPCQRSHSWIYGGDHFLVKNPLVLAFGIIENGRSWLFLTKMWVVWPLIIDQRLVHLTPYMFPCHRSHFGFLVETIYWSKIRRCLPSVLLKMVVDAIFDKNRGCVAIDHRT
jgi:hypothetical protein